MPDDTPSSGPFYADGEWKDVGLALMQRNVPALVAAVSQVAASVAAAQNGLPAGPAVVGLVGGGVLAGTQWLLAKLTLRKLRVDRAVRESAEKLALEQAVHRAVDEAVFDLRCGRGIDERYELDLTTAHRELQQAAHEVMSGLSYEVEQIQTTVAQIDRLLRNSLPNPQARVWPFLDEYLRPKGQTPVPFGGRDTELERLTCWLTDSKSGSRFLVTAPAGRGKSALMVRWVAHLAARQLLAVTAAEADDDRWHAIFVPVSIRFRTNRPEDYHLLLAKALANLVKPEGGLGQPAYDPSGFYADRANEYFEYISGSRKRVLIVLDGLDESLYDFLLLRRVDAGRQLDLIPPA